jgi:hypothetical protein
MKWYRRAWWSVTGLLVVLGTVAALLVLSVWGALVTFALSALVAGASAHVWPGSDDRRHPTTVGLAVAGAVLATTALLKVLGPDTLWLVLLLVATAPGVVVPVARWCGGRPGSTAPTPPAAADGAALREHDAALRWSAERTVADATWMTGPVSAMQPGDLCAAWRVSHLSLRQPLTAGSRDRLVQRRRELLDEFERRNPEGFQAWLDAGARATGQPGRYIFSRGRPDARS